MSKFLVSIIIPVYKVEPYLRRCLDSIVNQTYSNLEIILIDDGSPDNCPQICDEYAAKDNRIIVIHKENGGLSDARNTGTEHAHGDYIYYLDSDDELPLDSIHNFIEYAKTYSDAEIIVGKMHCPQNEAMYKGQLFDSVQTFQTNVEFRKLFSSTKEIFPVNACNKLIKNDFILKKNLLFKKVIIHEDQLWEYFVSKVASNVVCINKHTYIRYITPDSIMTGSSNDARICSWGIILEKIFSEINQPLFAEQFYKYFTLFEPISNQLNHNSTSLYKDVWKSCLHCTLRNHFTLLAGVLFFHKLLLNITKGHGTGFAIWLLCTKIYRMKK